MSSNRYPEKQVIFKMKLKEKIFTINVGLLSYSVQATTYYIDKSGSDQWSGTRDQPYRTINRGAANEIPGDTVSVMAGVYRKSVAPPRNCEPNKPIVYLAEPEKEVYIKGSEISEPLSIIMGVRSLNMEKLVARPISKNQKETESLYCLVGPANT